MQSIPFPSFFANLARYIDTYTRQGGISDDDYYLCICSICTRTLWKNEWPVEQIIYTFLLDMTNIEGITLYHYQGNVYRKDLFVYMQIIRVIHFSSPSFSRSWMTWKTNSTFIVEDQLRPEKQSWKNRSIVWLSVLTD